MVCGWKGNTWTVEACKEQAMCNYKTNHSEMVWCKYGFSNMCTTKLNRNIFDKTV